MASKIRLSETRASLYPVPTVLVTCKDGDAENILTISWTGIMCSKPPIVYIAVRPERYSYQIIDKSKRFCINIPSDSLLEEVDFCGNNSGKNVDKAKYCSFEYISLLEGYPRAIRQCKHHLFCEVIDKLPLGSHTAFIAEVKQEFIDDDCYIDSAPCYSHIKPIAYCRKDYYALSNKIGTYGKQKGENK